MIVGVCQVPYTPALTAHNGSAGLETVHDCIYYKHDYTLCVGSGTARLVQHFSKIYTLAVLANFGQWGVFVKTNNRVVA